MNQSGIRVPQSIGATALPGSLPPKLMPTEGSPASRNAASTRHANAESETRSSDMAGGAPLRCPATRPATTTPSVPEMWTLCGVAMTTVSALDLANSRPRFVIPRWVITATSSSPGAQASRIAIEPCGAMAANTNGMAADTIVWTHGAAFAASIDGVQPRGRLSLQAQPGGARAGTGGFAPDR